MKVLLCLNRDIYCTLALNYLSSGLSGHQVKIYFSNRVGKAPTNPQLQKLQKFEQDLAIQNIVYLIKKAEIININQGEILDFDQISKTYQMSILNFNNINSDGWEYLSKEWQPDLIISIRFGQIFKEPIITLPKLGIINLHSGILPDYRGIMATFWAMLHKEKIIGTTLHFINDQSIDTGDIIAIYKINTNYKQSFISNVLNLYQGGVETILATIKQLETNQPIGLTKQNHGLGRYFSYPDDNNIKEYSGLFY